MGFTQERAAEALGISRATLSLYERGERYDAGMSKRDRKVVIPRTVELAMAAVEAGITLKRGRR